MKTPTPTADDREFLQALNDSIAGQAYGSDLTRFRTEAGERAKRRCARYGWAVYHRIGPIWAITPAGRASLQPKDTHDV